MTTNRLWKAMILISLMSVGVRAFAVTPLSAGMNTEYFNPERTGHTIDSLLTAPLSTPWVAFDGSLNLGYQDTPVWVRIAFEPARTDATLLEIAYPNLDVVDVYYTRGQELVSTIRTGDRSPFSQRPWPHRHFIVPLLERDFDHIYLRVQTSTSVQIPLRLLTSTEFSERDQASLVRQGLFLGVLLVMALYNLFIYLRTRETSFILYVGYVTSMALYQAFHHGLTFQYLWPESPNWHNISGGLFIASTVGFVSLFSRDILALRQASPLLGNYLKGAAHIALGLFLLSFAFSYSVIARLTITLAIPTALFIISAGVVLWYRGMRPAKFFTLGWTAFLIGAIAFGLSKLGFLPHNLFTENALQVGATIEVLLLSVALAERLNEERQERRRVQARLLTEQRSLTEAYARFVPIEFMRLLGKRKITDIQLGDHREMRMTILFSDVRSFTTIAESLTPRDTFMLLNEYLGRMAPVIAKHGGYVDKYMGDGIMALFPADSNQAVAASADMHQTLIAWNAERRAKGLFMLEIGVGLNTGDMMVGTIGAAGRMEGTVISDCVNTASRIESLNKLYGTAVLLSESTFRTIPESHRYNFRLLDRVRVKGKSEPVMLYELLDALPEDICARRLKTRDIFQDALYAYWNGEFERAVRAFQKCLDIDPEDKASILLNERANWQARSGAASKEWTGAFDMNVLLQKETQSKEKT